MNTRKSVVEVQSSTGQGSEGTRRPESQGECGSRVVREDLGSLGSLDKGTQKQEGCVTETERWRILNGVGVNRTPCTSATEKNNRKGAGHSKFRTFTTIRFQPTRGKVNFVLSSFDQSSRRLFHT